MFKRFVLSLALLAVPFKGMSASTDADPRYDVVTSAIASSPVVRQAIDIANARRTNQAAGLTTMLAAVADRAASLSDSDWEKVRTDALASLSPTLTTAFTDLAAALTTAVGTPTLPVKSDYIPVFWHKGKEGAQAAAEFLSNSDNFIALRAGKTPAGYEVTPPAYVFENDGTLYSNHKATTLSTALFHVLQILFNTPTIDATGRAVMGEAWDHSMLVDFLPLPSTFTAPESFRSSAYYRPALGVGGTESGGFIAYLNNGYNLGANHVKPSNCADCSSYVTAVCGPRREDVPYGPATLNFRHLASRRFGQAHDWDGEAFHAGHRVVEKLAEIYEPIKPESETTSADAAPGLLWARAGHIGFVLGADPAKPETHLLVLGANRNLPGLDGFGIIQSMEFDPATGKNLFFRVK